MLGKIFKNNTIDDVGKASENRKIRPIKINKRLCG